MFRLFRRETTPRRRLLPQAGALLAAPLLAASLLAAPLLGASPAAAQGTWPDRPIRMLVPFAAGGITDSIGRLSAEWMGARLGVPVVVENRSGANGAIAAEAVARARPDGYTLLVASVAQLAQLPLLTTVPYDVERDFQPISIVGTSPFVLTVRASLGLATLQDFVAYAKARPGALDYGSAGTGTTSHLGSAMLWHMLGLELQHVPYRGGAPAMQDLLAGQIPVLLANYSDLAPQIDNPALRILAVASPSRLPTLPQVPTLEEAGVRGYQASTWNSIVAPRGIPPEVTAKLAAALRPACQDAAFQAELARLSTTPICNSPEEFATFMRRDTDMWREVVRETGARID